MVGLAALVTGTGTIGVVAAGLGTATAGVALLVAAPVPPPAAERPGERETEPARLVDPSTGLYGHDFFQATLASRVATARRLLRPLSLVLFEVVERTDGGAVPVAEAAVKAAITATLRESDLACRTGDGGYALLLEDTGEDGAVWTAERVRRNLGATHTDRVFRAGVASYPSHGLDQDELLVGATQALRLARDWQRDRIEVAAPV